MIAVAARTKILGRVVSRCPSTFFLGPREAIACLCLARRVLCFSVVFFPTIVLLHCAGGLFSPFLFYLFFFNQPQRNRAGQ
ncbi:hypothetical protein [Pandoravirus japonicus]|uniref:Transmembrane protein n=1 Tax=Pandoravirus japonicus TaxID=2823154 RepID=A0A811BLL5_9VIRU|nr:hypothetical protein [Pandoravirus japonicus]